MTKPTFLLDLIVKYALITVILFITLAWIGGVTWTSVLRVSVWVTIVAYFTVDVLVYRWAGNVAASLTDILISAFTLWLTLLVMRIPHYSWDVWLSAVAIGGGEALYHRYLKQQGYRIGSTKIKR